MRKTFILFLLLVFAQLLAAQKTYTLSGSIKSSDGEALIGASVVAKGLFIGTSADVNGEFELELPAGEYEIAFSFIGFKELVKQVEMNEDIHLNVTLSPSVNELEEVIITDEKQNANVERVEMSVHKIDAQAIKKIPALLGEADVIKSILLLPGVSTVGEGSTGFNVRGGGIDQNLVLMDEAPVYNSSHLFGFFSVFNPDAVESVRLIKAGIAPEFGGRLSSILDVDLRKGNENEFKVNGGVGVIFSRLAIEGPIVKDKTSFVLAGRRSYADILAKPFLNEGLKGSKFYFYDFTAKLNHKFNNKNNMYFSLYHGRDVFGAGFQFDWGNSTASLGWNHVFNKKLLLDLSAYYSNYDYAFGMELEDESEAFFWNSSIVSYSLKPEFTYYLNNNNTLKFGIQSIYYNFEPAVASITSESETSNIELDDKYALEHAFFIQNEQKIGSRLSLLYGIRHSIFEYMGEGKKITYGDTTIGHRKPVESIESYDRFEPISVYHNWEPRFSLKYSLTEFSSLKLSYNRMSQSLHLISNTIASTPVDIWMPTTNNIEPQLADQIALGYFRNFKDNSYEASAEVFVKKFQNQIDYIDNAELFFNEFLEGDLLSGTGRAYGLEFYLKKTKGDFTGWLSYTLSRSERKVEGINRGEWYPNRYDRLHNLSLVGSYELNDRWSFSGNFIFSSGTPVTFPTNRYEIQGAVIKHNVNEARNHYRIPAYHRMDISATYVPKANEGRKWKGEWVFSIYNVYSRKNPFSIYFRQNEEIPRNTEAVRFAVIGRPIPAISYNFKF